MSALALSLRQGDDAAIGQSAGRHRRRKAPAQTRLEYITILG